MNDYRGHNNCKITEVIVSTEYGGKSNVRFAVMRNVGLERFFYTECLYVGLKILSYVGS